VVGVAVNTSSVDEQQALLSCEQISQRTGLPCVDPIRHGVTQLLERLL
jgi:uncharacterized NAD-dependent epimerase/dehydratase family protein